LAPRRARIGVSGCLRMVAWLCCSRWGRGTGLRGRRRWRA
jgi:hypothetical protein